MNEEANLIEMCPYLEVSLPHPLAGDFDEKVKDVKEIYEFFRSKNEEAPMLAFIEHYSKLPHFTGMSKMTQVLHSIRLIKIAERTKAELRSMGIQ